MMNVMRDERGQALAEFALIMPILFLLIAGILGFGRAYNIQQVVVDAAREGARVAGIIHDTELLTRLLDQDRGKNTDVLSTTFLGNPINQSTYLTSRQTRLVASAGGSHRQALEISHAASDHQS